MVVGGMGSAARHVSDKALNKADEMAGLTPDNGIINDGSQPPIDVNNTPMADTDIASDVNETPDYINETPLGNVEIDDISNASYSPMMEESGFATAVNKSLSKLPPQKYAEMMNKLQDERANIIELHGNKSADQLSPRMFEENFTNAGLEPKYARLVSRNLYNDIVGSNNVETVENTNEAPQEESLAYKADRLGVTLTDAERVNLERENPDKTSVREIERRIVDAEKNNAYNEQIRTVAEHRQAYNEDRYVNSHNKTFFENEYKGNPYKAQDAAYRMHNAMEARKKDANSSDIKKKEQSKNIRNYLAKAGIKPANNYSANELKSITDYAKHMDNQERTSKNVSSYIQNRDMAKEVENIINTLPPKTSPDYLPAKRNLAQQLSKHLVTMGVNGFDVTGPQFDNVRKILSTQEKRMLQANVEEAKRAREETRRANAQLAERKPQDIQKFVSNKQMAVPNRNIAHEDKMMADYLNGGNVEQDGLLWIQKYLYSTGRGIRIKYQKTMEALQHRASNGDIIGGREGNYNVFVKNPSKQWETRKDYKETTNQNNPTREETIVTPYEERKALNPAQPKDEKKKAPSKPRTVDITTDEQKAKIRDTNKLAKLRTALQEFGQMNEVVAKQIIDKIPMETKYGKEQKQKYKEYVLRQANEDTGDIDLSDDIQKPEDVASKYTDTIKSIEKDIENIKSNQYMSLRDYSRIHNSILAKRNHLVRNAPAFLNTWDKILSDVPKFKMQNVTELMKAIRNGKVKIPQTVLSSFIDKPSYFDANIAKWMMRDYMLSKVE